jgi:hypothetical protein
VNRSSDGVRNVKGPGLVLSAAVVLSLLTLAGAHPAWSGTGSDVAGAQREVALERARKALAAGDTKQAVELADALLAVDPADAAAADIKVRAFADARDADTALDAYEAWRKASRRDDEAMLGVLGRAHLRDLAEMPTAQIRMASLRGLAQAGDAAARRALAQAAAEQPETSGDGLLARHALASLGDEAALRDLRRVALSGPPALRSAVLGLLAEVDPAGVEPAIKAALGDRDIGLRIAALAAARTAGGRTLVPVLQSLLQERPYLIALHAAVALWRLDDRSGEGLLRQALQSELPDARLTAAEAFVSDPDGSWTAAVEPLLKASDALVRLKAATLLLGRHPGARDAVLDALRDPNPVIRAEAAKVFASTEAFDAEAAVPLLRDTSPWVRLPVAARLARPSAARPPR